MVQISRCLRTSDRRPAERAYVATHAEEGLLFEQWAGRTVLVPTLHMRCQQGRRRYRPAIAASQACRHTLPRGLRKRLPVARRTFARSVVLRNSVEILGPSHRLVLGHAFGRNPLAAIHKRKSWRDGSDIYVRPIDADVGETSAVKTVGPEGLAAADNLEPGTPATRSKAPDFSPKGRCNGPFHQRHPDDE
jgi:hypothetical protein